MTRYRHIVFIISVKDELRMSLVVRNNLPRPPFLIMNIFSDKNDIPTINVLYYVTKKILDYT